MDSDNLHRRLKKISGQINALDHMIDEDIPCEDILVQVNAVKSALHNVGRIIMIGHINHCVKDGIINGDTVKTLESFEKVLDQYAKI